MLIKYKLMLVMNVFFFWSCTQQDGNKLNGNVFDASKSDFRAIEVVDEMWEALGGYENWQQIRFLSYHWILEVDGNVRSDYRHDWDRYTNSYRVEGTNRNDQHFVATFNTKTKVGEVFVDGTKVQEDTTRTKWLNRAYGRFINDSYWLLMPYKLKDPGVILNYEGEKEVAGENYDVIKVSFEGVGLTPGDTYWAYIDKTDRLMDRWDYKLQGWEADREPTTAWWRDWQSFGQIKLATSKEFEGRSARIFFKNIIASLDVDRGIFNLTSKTF